MKTLCIVLLLSSCSPKINGVRISEKKQPDKAEVFYMTVSLMVGYGLGYHFLNRK